MELIPKRRFWGVTVCKGIGRKLGFEKVRGSQTQQPGLLLTKVCGLWPVACGVKW